MEACTQGARVRRQQTDELAAVRPAFWSFEFSLWMPWSRSPAVAEVASRTGNNITPQTLNAGILLYNLLLETRMFALTRGYDRDYGQDVQGGAGMIRTPGLTSCCLVLCEMRA